MHFVGDTHGIRDLDQHHGMHRDLHIVTSDDRLHGEVEDGLTQIHDVGEALVVLHLGRRAGTLRNHETQRVVT